MDCSMRRNWKCMGLRRAFSHCRIKSHFALRPGKLHSHNDARMRAAWLAEGKVKAAESDSLAR